MKTIKVLLTALVISGISVSCSSDDDGGNPTGGDLTAKWNQTKTVTKISSETYTEDYEDNSPSCGHDYLEFTDDNEVNFAVWNLNGDLECSESFATNLAEWQRDGNTLIIGGTNVYYSGTYEIKRLTGSQLQIQSSSSSGGTTTTTTIYFTKAAQQ